MALPDFRAIVDRIDRWAVRASLYDMGEPLLNKKLYDMIRYCSDRRISTLISTNFTLFKRKDADALFASELTVLEPCLDGISQETYGTYRVGGDVDVVKDNIRFVMAEKRRRQATYPIVDTQVILFRHLQHEYGEIEGFLNEVGVDKVTFRPENLGFVSEGAEPSSCATPASSGAPTSPYQAEAKTRPTESHRCHWLYVGMMVRPDGNAYPCSVATSTASPTATSSSNRSTRSGTTTTTGSPVRCSRTAPTSPSTRGWSTCPATSATRSRSRARCRGANSAIASRTGVPVTLTRKPAVEEVEAVDADA